MRYPGRVRPSPTTLAALVVCGVLGLGLARWWWQPRAAAAATRDTELDATLERMARELDTESQTRAEARTLRWRFAEVCTQVYEFTIDESFADESVAVFLGRAEEHSRWWLAIGSHPRLPDRLGALLIAHEPLEPVDAGKLRELFASTDGRALGPAAPDLACRARTWDPLEDALALGWPRLPNRPVRPGDRWVGHVVGGRCHETPCLDAKGEIDRARACQARPWTEQVAGWLESETETATAVLRSTWTDGHTGPVGIVTTRELVIAEGRPLLAYAEIWQRWVGVVRQLELRAIGECTPGADLARAIADARDPGNR